MKRKLHHKNKMIGEFDDEKLVFRKVVSGKKHLMKILDSWGIDRKVLYQLPPKTIIRIKDRDDGTVYVTSAMRFRQGALLSFLADYDVLYKKAEHEHGVQVFFPRRFFNRVTKSGEKIRSIEGDEWWGSLVWFKNLPDYATEQLS